MMPKSRPQDKITRSFISDGSPYDKCKKCINYTREGGVERCKKYEKFMPAIAFRCYKYNPDFKTNSVGGV